jgi:peroxiredoxin
MNAKSDVYQLPEDLVAPKDDGAADHLLGLRVPCMRLPSTMGTEVDLAEAATGTLVIYVYPMTGTPGKSPPEGWDEIPGARGCTPENCAFRDHYSELAELGASVLGLSAQSFEEQRDFAGRERLPYPLLNDSPLKLAQELGLPTFEAASMRLYKRLTLVVQNQKIVKVFYPIFPPGSHPGEVIAWLQQHVSGETSSGPRL